MAYILLVIWVFDADSGLMVLATYYQMRVFSSLLSLGLSRFGTMANEVILDKSAVDFCLWLIHTAGYCELSWRQKLMVFSLINSWTAHHLKNSQWYWFWPHDTRNLTQENWENSHSTSDTEWRSVVKAVWHYSTLYVRPFCEIHP